MSPMSDVKNRHSVAEKLKFFILKNYLFTDDATALKDDQSLMQTSVMDSTGILELIMFLEETFRIKVNDEEMVPENLDSVNAIVRFVASKL
jgi:acyl carrier protein